MRTGKCHLRPNNTACTLACGDYGKLMESQVSMLGESDDERREVRRNLVRRASELASIHGRAEGQPSREDLQQAKREVKPMKLRAKSPR